jgi:hypothetical protein
MYDSMGEVKAMNSTKTKLQLDVEAFRASKLTPTRSEYEMIDWISVLEEAYRQVGEERDKLHAELADSKEWIDSLCADLCKMEDALGFKHDCHDEKGAWVPTIGPWLERVRDLIAAEGELEAVRAELEQANELHNMQLAGVMTASMQNTESTIKDRIDRTNPYWTQAYADVCTTVDREMRERARAERAESKVAGKEDSTQ